MLTTTMFLLDSKFVFNKIGKEFSTTVTIQ